MTDDLSKTVEPRSDQLNFDDVAVDPVTVTVTQVVVNPEAKEQPVAIHLAEFPDRPFKPSKSMRRVLIAAWGKDSKVYAGRRMRLYGDPTVRFGGQEIGGIRISHLSHIPKKLTIALTVTRAKRSPFTVEPLEPPRDESGRDWLKELAAVKDDPQAIGALGLEARAANAAEPVMQTIRKAYKDAGGN